jgi:uncharacterized membrane protein
VPRLLSLDALRGVAVILMMEQHLGVWLWQPEHPGRGLLAQAPGYMAINGLGGLAAPTFITLAGVGTSLLVHARAGTSIDATLVRRGLALLGFGYLLNFLTPSWFSAGSWFVLHMMGLAIATAPLWRRLSGPLLLVGEAVILALTVLAQHLLNTPLLLDNPRMRDLDLPGGALRLALAEGQFPVLPWLAVFLAGVAIGRWLQDDSPEPARRVAALCRVCLLTGAALVGLDYAAGQVPALAFLHDAPWWRVVRVRTSFYPAGPGIVLLLQSGVLLMLVVALRIERSRELDPRGWLVCLGRTSLTLLLVHVVLFREISRPLGAWQAFDRTTALLIIAAWIALCALLCRVWQRFGFRFGAEWLLRRLGG